MDDRLPKSVKHEAVADKSPRTQLSGGQAVLRIGKEKCPYCYRSDVYVSDPNNLWEEFTVLLLLRPVRMPRLYASLLPSAVYPNAGFPKRSSALKKPTQQTDTAKSDKQRLA